MHIETYPFAAAVTGKDLSGKTVVVIDVLRATSVMVTALANGAKAIVPLSTLKGANRESRKYTSGNCLVCGERNAQKTEGFDLGNSPLEFTRDIVEGKTLIMTTTNGTKALNACRKAGEVYIGAFLNADAVVQQVKDEENLVLFCAGTNGKFSLDDGLCAGMIIDRLSRLIPIRLDDLGQLLLKLWRSSHGNITKTLADCSHLKYLIANGYEKDVSFCLQTDTHEIMPFYDPQRGIIDV